METIKKILTTIKHVAIILVDYSAWYVSAVFTVRLFVSFSRFAKDDRLGWVLLFAVAIVFEVGKARVWYKSHGCHGMRRYIYRFTAFVISIVSLVATAGQVLRYTAVVDQMQSVMDISKKREAGAEILEGVARTSLDTMQGLGESYLTWKDRSGKAAVEAVASADEIYDKLEEATIKQADNSEVEMFISMAKFFGIEPGKATTIFWLSIAFLLEVLYYLMTYPIRGKDSLLRGAAKWIGGADKGSIDRVDMDSVMDRVAREYDKKMEIKERDRERAEAMSQVVRMEAEDRCRIQGMSGVTVDPPISIREYRIRSKPRSYDGNA